jgi:glutaconate CoA-transferase subunit B
MSMSIWVVITAPSLRSRRNPGKRVTNLGVLGFDDAGEMELRSVHPDVTVEQVRRETGWPLKIARNIGETEPPTEEELQVLRALQREQSGVGNERAPRTDAVGQT